MTKRGMRLAGIIQEAEIKFNLPIPEHIQTLKNAFTKHGKKLYVVGGAVRDAVLGKIPKDYDVATDSPAAETSALLNAEGIHNFPKGESFGVISAVLDGEEYEIATFRTESYEGGDGRRPTSVGLTDIEGDVSRRDLTINALYYDLEKGVIIDLVGGMDDIKNKRIRAVGDPYERFKEDRLRILRALRFAHRFDSQLDERTVKAAMEFKDLPGVSNERIRAEFIAGLNSAVHPETYLRDYQKLGLIPRTFDGNMTLNLNFAPGLRDYLLVIANIYINHADLKAVFKSLTRLTFETDEKEAIIFLIRLQRYLKDLDAVSFSPEAEARNLSGLLKARDQAMRLLSDSQIKEWGRLTGIPSNTLSSFMQFRPSISAKDFPDLQGPELGAAISKANAEAFLKTL